MQANPNSAKNFPTALTPKPISQRNRNHRKHRCTAKKPMHSQKYRRAVKEGSFSSPSI